MEPILLLERSCLRRTLLQSRLTRYIPQGPAIGNLKHVFIYVAYNEQSCLGIAFMNVFLLIHALINYIRNFDVLVVYDWQAVKPRPLQAASIPGMLGLFQNVRMTVKPLYEMSFLFSRLDLSS
jgi:hypothetical protein